MIEQSTFDIFREIDSLEKYILSHQANISQNNKRVESIHKQRAVSETELTKINSQLSKDIKELNALETNLNKYENRINLLEERLKVVADNKQLTLTENELEQIRAEKIILENLILDLIDKTDNETMEVNNLNTFLSGSKNTLTEIEKEVAADNSTEQKNIKNYEERINSLIETIPPLVLSIYRPLKENFKRESVLTREKNGKCEKCHFELNKNAMETLHKRTQLVKCNYCQRIFVP
ncbi:MAG: hypothetical protein U0T83_03095 [Bacteriovoracaceae bacterium]